jgi:hypothetical protein
VWALYEVVSARQFDQAAHPHGVRQMVFGHRHHSTAVNVGRFNRQIGIAVDFDQGGGGYLLVGPSGLTFRQFTDRADHRYDERKLVVPVGNLSSTQTHLHDVEEHLYRQLVEHERQLFRGFPLHSKQARREFEHLEALRGEQFDWIHRLYAELYQEVKDLDLRKEMLAAAVASGDENAFRSFIHLLFQKTRELESYGQEWFS